MHTRVFIPSGAGAPGFGGILHCLEQAGFEVAAGDLDPQAYGRGLVKQFSPMPASTSPEYIPRVIETAVAFGCNVILPITTAELMPLAENSSRLQQAGLNIAITDPRNLAIANNKRLLYKFLKDKISGIPHFAVIRNKAELMASLADFGFPARPVFIKPSAGNGSRGIRMITTAEQARETWFSTKAGGLITSPVALMAEMPGEFPCEYLLCEYLPGTEYSVDLISDRGIMQVCLPRTRQKTVSGISVAGTFVQHTHLIERCREICKLLSLHGPIGIQFKEDENTEPKLLEINPRLQGAVSTGLFMGINFPALAAELALGNPLNIPPIAWQKPVSFGRYWADVLLK